MPNEYRDEEVKVDLELEDGETPATVTTEAIAESCEADLSTFKIPRFVAYVDDYPFTASSKIDKPALIRGVNDLRAGAWDREAAR